MSKFHKKINLSIIILLAFFNTCVFGKKIAISLGQSCGPAMQLRVSLSRHYGIRDQAFPFDWLITPFDALYKCLQEDFVNFLNPAYLSLYNHASHCTGILDSYYGLRFIHDFPTIDAPDTAGDGPTFGGFIVTNFLDYLDPIKEKYERRIARFRKTLSGTDEIIFIRDIITKQQSILLYNLIKSYYPTLNFTLVVVDSTEEMKYPWNLSGIKNFYGPNSFTFGPQWIAILQNIGLL